MIFLCVIVYRSHVYDAVELHSHESKRSSTSEFPLVSSSSKMPSITESQDIKANEVNVQENPSYAPVTSDTNTLQGDYTYVCTSDYI